MSSTKPIIGVTGPDKGGTAAWLFSKLAVILQGGKAIRIRPKDPQPAVQLDGLILGGGADIDPARYGQSIIESPLGKGRKPKGFYQWMIHLISLLLYPFLFLIRKLSATKSSAVDIKRDKLEFDLLDSAIKNNIPVLGICRGSQLINIYFGGNLHQDIDTYYGEIPQVYSVWPKKKVELKKGSQLRQIIGSSSIWVNALHHQAVDKQGSELEVVAKEETGLAQAIEHSASSFLIGVQWHPEYMPQIRAQRKIFGKLVQEAKQ
ncbi:MAG: gamma-glutamyl-gamma-aminobutyrate hydrolase family protein [Balneolaceae bacterium]|nr:gamma-glutamyl-gamma-aminobutyrate hydrolase family protein [Balneolaceae bacterium]